MQNDALQKYAVTEGNKSYHIVIGDDKNEQDRIFIPGTGISVHRNGKRIP